MNLLWMKQAACLGLDPSLFFSEMDIDGQDTRVNTAGAREVCRSCSVRMECLMSAYENREEFGIWGGVTPSERRPHRIKQTIEMVQTEIEYLRIMDMTPERRRVALRGLKAKTA